MSSSWRMLTSTRDARFDGQCWTVRWKWSGSEPASRNRLAKYKVDKDLQKDFDREMNVWIQEGILSPVPSDVVVTLVVPLMAVEQTNKGKVRPVLDSRQLNEFVSSHPGGSAVCDETVRKWRQRGGDTSLVDLRKAWPAVSGGPCIVEAPDCAIQR